MDDFVNTKKIKKGDLGDLLSSSNETLRSALKKYIDFLKYCKSLNDLVPVLKENKNLIIQGAPGTGKTYVTREIAVRLCKNLDKFKFEVKYASNRAQLIHDYNELLNNGRIGFCTFHQSMDYEEFVEGLKPDIDSKTNKGTGTFSVRKGLFKRMCEVARNLKITSAIAVDEDTKASTPCILIIDEINRANISKVLGELITLIEPSKRDGGSDPYSAVLPYSQEQFSVPDNLYILGTMNTADRSLGSIDYAIRRRFAFRTLVSDESLISDQNAKIFEKIKDFISETKDSDFETDDIMIGHSYFMGSDIGNSLHDKIVPLLVEYIKDGVLDEDKVKDYIENWEDKTSKAKQIENWILRG